MENEKRFGRLRRLSPDGDGMSDIALVTAFPGAPDAALHWWHVVDGKVVRHGLHAEPRLAAGLTDPNAVFTQVALVPTGLARVKWVTLDGALSPKQATRVAEAQLLAQTIGGADAAHAVAAPTGDTGEMAVAIIDRAALAEGLVWLRAGGIDPDIVLPAGLAIWPPDEGVIEADFGFDRLLRARRAVVADEPALRDHLIGSEESITALNSDDLDTHIALLPDYNGPNLRSGPFTKKRRTGFSEAQKKLALTLVAAVLILSLLIPVVRLAKLHFAADAAEDGALAAARTVAPEVADLDAANAALDQQLASAGVGNAAFGVPTSALFAVLQNTPQVAVQTLGYQPNGAISVRLSGPSDQALNGVVAALQNDGYVVTANPAVVEGGAGADITVRGF